MWYLATHANNTSLDSKEDSHSKPMALKHALRVYNKLIRPRSKAWYCAWLTSSGTRGIDTGVGSYTADAMSMKGRP
jgi:hypothetical protein